MCGGKSCRNLHLKAIVTLIILLGLSLPGRPVRALSTVFVSPGGSGTTCSQASPCNLATGLSLADAGGTLYAAAGPYTGSGNQVVTLARSINFLGGWNGAASGTPTRDPLTYPSILDGQNMRRVITIAGDPSDILVVDGWTIRNGNANGLVTGCSPANAAGCGGGVLVTSGTVTIEHNIIKENVAATTTGDPARTGYGGGIYLQNPAVATIRFNSIHSNHASTAESGPVGSNGLGGGIYASGAVTEGDLMINNNELYSNDAAASGYMGYGGGMALAESHGLISGNSVHDNAPDQSSLGAALFAAYSDLTVSDNLFINNLGGEILYLVDFSGSLDANIIINPLGGYGLFITMNSPGRFSVLTNNIIAQHQVANLATNGISDSPVTVNLYQDTLDDSEYGLTLSGYSYVTLSNSIISNQIASEIHLSGSNNTVYVNYTLFYGNAHDGTWPGTVNHPVSPGDPLYVDAAAGNYHIQSTSAARDVAFSAAYSTDFEGDPRPMGIGTTPYDVGADEFWWKMDIPIIQKP